MTYSFNILIILGILLFQTSVSPVFGILNGLFDPLIIFVTYAALYRPFKESLVSVIFMGLLMDSISCSPFGLYTTIYTWMFVGLKWILKYLHAGNFILIPVILFMAILSQHLLTIVLLAVLENSFQLHLEIFRLISVQLFWGVCIGPFLILFIKNLRVRWENRVFEKVFEHFG